MGCDYCGSEYDKWHKSQKYCSDTCRIKAYKRQAGNIKSEFGEIVPYQPKPRKVVETDAEQRKIREALAKKWENKPSEVKHYRPCDPEFDRIAQQILNVHQIRNVSALYGLAQGSEKREHYGEV